MNPCWDIQQSDTVAQVAGQYTGVVSRTQLQKHVSCYSATSQERKPLGTQKYSRTALLRPLQVFVLL